MTLRENNLKEIEGGRILDSEGVLVANKRALKENPRLLKLVHELIERFEVNVLYKSCNCSDSHKTPAQPC